MAAAVTANEGSLEPTRNAEPQRIHACHVDADDRGPRNLPFRRSLPETAFICSRWRPPRRPRLRHRHARRGARRATPPAANFATCRCPSATATAPPAPLAASQPPTVRATARRQHVRRARRRGRRARRRGRRARRRAASAPRCEPPFEPRRPPAANRSKAARPPLPASRGSRLRRRRTSTRQWERRSSVTRRSARRREGGRRRRLPRVSRRAPRSLSWRIRRRRRGARLTSCDDRCAIPVMAPAAKAARACSP